MMMRQATIDDFDFIYKGRLEIKQIEQYENDDHEDQQLEIEKVKEAIQCKRIWIAESETKSAGFIWLVVSKKFPFGVDYVDFEQDYVFIDFVYVAPEFRNKGIGGYMYKWTEQYCRDHGIKEIILDVMENNSNSKMFHMKIGFQPFVTLYSKKIEPLSSKVSQQ
jgi:GNAT superfamily N-acetyltransferase